MSGAQPISAANALAAANALGRISLFIWFARMIKDPDDLQLLSIENQMVKTAIGKFLIL